MDDIFQVFLIEITRCGLDFIQESASFAELHH